MKFYLNLSKSFKKIFLIRFFSYLSIFIAFLSVVFQYGPVLSSEFNYRKDNFFGIEHIVSNASSSSTADEAESGFGDLLGLNPPSIVPVSTDFGIVIEKINANARVIEGIDPGNENDYQQALKQGVVAAKGSTNPGKPGNLYIFSHSTDAAWNIVRYNAIFYLLRELTSGDRVIIFYQGRRYDYIVYDKQVASPSDISYLQNRYDQPVLTLQTCDPPGTLNNRLIIRAKLAGK